MCGESNDELSADCLVVFLFPGVVGGFTRWGGRSVCVGAKKFTCESFKLAGLRCCVACVDEVEDVDGVFLHMIYECV